MSAHPMAFPETYPSRTGPSAPAARGAEGGAYMGEMLGLSPNARARSLPAAAGFSCETALVTVAFGTLSGAFFPAVRIHRA